MKTGKRIVSIFLVVLMLLTAAPLAGFVGLEIAPKAKALAATGQCGDNVYWNFDSSTGALTISGTGATYDYSPYSNTNPFHESSDIITISIAYGVTSIGTGLFPYCTELESISLSNSVKSIESQAFLGCSSLTSMTIPDSLTSIDILAFEQCYSIEFFRVGPNNNKYSSDSFGCLYNKNKTQLIRYPSGNVQKDFTVESSVTSIGSFAFSGSHSLKSVTIPNSVTVLGNDAFNDCSALRSVSLPNNLTSIGDFAFFECKKLKNIEIPQSVTNIGTCAFERCKSLESVTIPDGVSIIEAWTFAECSALAAVEIQYGISKIDWDAFSQTALKSVVIPDSVEIIDSDAFSFCKELESVIIGNGVTTIGSSAFEGSAIINVTIGSNVTSIGHQAFNYCFSISDVYYCGTEEQWNQLSIEPLNDCLTNATIHFNFTGPYDDWSTPVEITVNSFGMTIPCTYQDAYFAKSPYSYNHKMAIASVALASAAMVSTEEHKKGIFNDPERDPIPEPDGSSDYEERVKEIKAQFRAKEFYEAAGFDNYTPRYYNEKPTENSIAFVIASKNIDEIQSTVISIAIRGGGYDAEWGGNFNVGTTQEHRGFSAAADRVFHALDEFLALYVNDIKYKDSIKYWITGYSRSAAVGNLVAAKLTSGDIPVSNNQFSNIERLLPKAVYAYLFEPPKTTKDENAKNSLYNNIFNIINREDPVPRVAPGEWGYKRYGKDCYLPSRETYAGKDYQTLCDKMKEEFVSVAGMEYEKFFSSKKAKENNVIDYHDFVYYDLTGDDSSVLSNCRTGLDLKMNHSFSQGLFYDNLIHYIAKGMKSSEAYSANFQQPITTLLVMAMSAGQYDIPIKDRFRWAVDSYFNDVSLLRNIALAALFKITDAPPWLKKYVLPDFIKDTLTDILYDVLKSEGVTKDSIESMVSATLKGVLPPLVLHYNSVFSALKNICNLVSAHYTQTTASWLLALDGIYEDENQQISNLLSHESTYRVATINCPVNVLVLDNTGNTRARIEDESVSDCLNPLSTYIDENGQKCVVLPNDDSYRFTFTGYDEGQMSVSFSTYDFETGEKLESLNFYDIPIQRGIEITGILSPKNDNSIADDVSLYNGTQSINPSEVVTNSEENLFTVAVESNTDNCYAVGGGTFFKGEYSQVTATAESEYVFDGWYIGDELVSPDANYRFRVDADVTLTAHFKPCVHQYTETVITAPTCTASGESTFTCSICSDTYTETIPALGHTDDNNDGHCDRCGEQMTGGDHCKFCGKIHNGGFFDKLTGFFHKIFAIFKR